jgi:UDP:flavonoid glycosyltransferase YjiC (YdhE family)
VPLIVLPQGAEDQFVNAKMVQDLMLGVTIEKLDVSARTLREATMQAMNEDAYRQHALRMGDAIKASGGYRAAANAILDYVSHN